MHHPKTALLAQTFWILLILWTRGGAADIIVDFEDLELEAESVSIGDESQQPIVSQEVAFNRTFEFGFPGAWVASNQTDLKTPGFGNPYSAYHLPSGGGVDGSENFLVAFNSDASQATVTFPQPTSLRGMYVTNTTYAYLAVAEGIDSDDGTTNFVKGPFTDGDFFQLTIRGLDATGTELASSDFLLADFRDGKANVVSTWTWTDLSGLGEVSALAFDLSSSDVGQFGMNTPAYFAIDNLTLVGVPEPGSWLLSWAGVLCLCHVLRIPNWFDRTHVS